MHDAPQVKTLRYRQVIQREDSVHRLREPLGTTRSVARGARTGRLLGPHRALTSLGVRALHATRPELVGPPLQIDDVVVQRFRLLRRYCGLDPRPARRDAEVRHALLTVGPP